MFDIKEFTMAIDSIGNVRDIKIFNEKENYPGVSLALLICACTTDRWIPNVIVLVMLNVPFYSRDERCFYVRLCFSNFS